MINLSLDRRTLLTLLRDVARTITLQRYAFPSFEGLLGVLVKRANEGADSF
jgi:hypothetical protein